MDVFDAILFVADIEVLEVEVVVCEVRHGRVDRLDCLGDPFLELVLLDHDRVYAQAGLETDIVDRLQVGRIGDAEEQALATLHQRQDAVLVDHLLVDGADAVDVQFDGVEIQ